MSRLQGADRRALVVGYRAVSELLRISGAEDAAGVLISVVVELGGTTVPARLAGDDALPLDLSFGHGEPLLPVAAPGSRARIRLTTLLPALLEDGRLAVARAERLSRLAEQVDVDPLTGLLNRRAVQRLLPRAAPGDAVLVIDLDRFKELNDTHGHAAGDGVLTAFSRLLREQGRAEDRYIRLGGEEFLGIFPATTVAEVSHGLQRLRSQWAKVAPLPVTFSAGVAAVGEQGGPVAVRVADSAMYDAKNAGRDRTVTREPDVIDVTRRDLPQPRRSTDRASHVSRALPVLLRHMSAFDVSSATKLGDRLIDDGATVTELTQLLAAAQEEVGRRWQSALWSVADEHGATAVADALLATVTAHAGRVDLDVHSPHVVVACPEGEWHQLPPRMLATLLADAGVSASVLGASLPARDMQRVLSRDRPTALVLCCTMVTNLPSAGASVAAAHESGVPVLVGGRAFGVDAQRADAVGADAWASDVDTAVELLHRWRKDPPRPKLPRKATEQPAVILNEGSAAAILDRIRADLPAASEFTAAQVRATRDDVRHIVEHLQVTLAIGDDRIFAEFTDWLSDVLTARGLSRDALAAGYRAIDEELCDGNPSARRLIRDALRRIT